ncbi:lanthionine synthetase C family protein [Streptomyces sp. RFCAC02]|uniref:lanthionine synthetase C family protein n=1 Tax=Streptomyces sp. RFCAC02 TaxID=2499143 RepID=UPI00101FB20E|nr:lanthionine synthetase C family protein [Streptomyces sp. RFCAC02]
MTALEDPGLREAATALADKLAAALAVPPSVDYGDDYRPDSPRWRDQSLSKGAAGVAVLHGLRAQLGRGGVGPVHAWLSRATRDELTAGPGAGLWFGAPSIAFALHLAAPGQYAGAVAELDTAVQKLIRTRLQAAHTRIDARLRPSPYEFDLTRGLAGLSAYLLHGAPDGDLLTQVLDYLVRLTEPVDAADPVGSAAPGWWTGDIPANEHDPAYADGHADFGMAHGCSGIVAALSLALLAGVRVDGHREAIARICRWLDAWRQDGTAGWWWPERITFGELATGRPGQQGPLRPSWCYGTPGLARAQQLAALATGDTARQQAAEVALVRCVNDPVQLSRLTDPALCHGLAGLVATTWHAAADAATDTLVNLLPTLVQPLLEHAFDTVPEGLPGLVEGNAGIALTLHTIATGTPSRWPACLLLA